MDTETLFIIVEALFTIMTMPLIVVLPLFLLKKILTG